MTIEVRPVRPDEYAALGDLTVAAYLAVGETDDHDYLEHIRDVATRAARLSGAGRRGRSGPGARRGDLRARPGTPYSELEHDGEAGIRMLAVDPDVQGRGVGRKLVEACLERARADGRRGMVLVTRPFMHSAHRLYDSLGFRRAPERDWWPVPDVELLAFELAAGRGAVSAVPDGLPPRDPLVPAEPRPAATIVLVRSAPGGLEVLLTRRPDTMAFAAGLHVFPGGRVEDGDGRPGLVRRPRGPRDDPAFGSATGSRRSARPGRRSASCSPTRPVGRSDRRPAGCLGRASGAAEDFAGLADRLDLTLRTDALVEIADWTTPRSMPRRFAARFFVAELPPDAVLRPDPREVAAHTWLTPRAALTQMAAGTIRMWPPTSTTLQRIERAASFAAIRDGLALVPDLPIGTDRIAPGLTVMTGQSAFGPDGRPANTVLVGRRDVVVVDPGDPGEAFLDAIEAEVGRTGGRIVAIALTHVDPGHAAGSEDLHTRTGAPIVAGPGGGADLSWAVTEIGDGAAVGEDDGGLTALATPGHRPDHLAYLTRDGTLLGGDALTDRPSVILPPMGDPVAQADSLARIGRSWRTGPWSGSCPVTARRSWATRSRPWPGPVARLTRDEPAAG